jgi:hypothetical protein
MKKIVLILCWLVPGLSLQAQTKQEQVILNLSEKKFQWMVMQNYDSLEPALDDRMVFVHSNGWAETKAEFIQDIKIAKLRYNSILVTEASARVYPASAVVIGRGKFNVKLDGKDLEFDLKYTEVYIQKNGKWLLASRHANRMQ